MHFYMKQNPLLFIIEFFFRSFSLSLDFPLLHFHNHTLMCAVRCWAEIYRGAFQYQNCAAAVLAGAAVTANVYICLPVQPSYMTSTIIDVDVVVVCNHHAHTPNKYKCVYYESANGGFEPSCMRMILACCSFDFPKTQIAQNNNVNKKEREQI